MVPNSPFLTFSVVLHSSLDKNLHFLAWHLSHGTYLQTHRLRARRNYLHTLRPECSSELLLIGSYAQASPFWGSISWTLFLTLFMLVPPPWVPIPLHCIHPSSPPFCALICELHGGGMHGLSPLYLRMDQTVGLALRRSLQDRWRDDSLPSASPSGRASPDGPCGSPGSDPGGHWWHLLCQNPGCNCTPRCHYASPPGSHHPSPLEWEGLCSLRGNSVV